jgi:phosphodiesterase/alkaline phosphatase D-like protein
MLGRVGATDFRVWARTSRPGTFRVRYGTAPLTLDGWSERATTTIEHDNTGWVLIKGLEPATEYYYQVVTDERWPVQPNGSFRTLPAAEAFRSADLNPKGLFNFSFDFGTCSNQHPMGAGPWPPA